MPNETYRFTEIQPPTPPELQEALAKECQQGFSECNYKEHSVSTPEGKTVITANFSSSFFSRFERDEETGEELKDKPTSVHGANKWIKLAEQYTKPGQRTQLRVMSGAYLCRGETATDLNNRLTETGVKPGWEDIQKMVDPIYGEPTVLIDAPKSSLNPSLNENELKRTLEQEVVKADNRIRAENAGRDYIGEETPQAEKAKVFSIVEDIIKSSDSGNTEKIEEILKNNFPEDFAVSVDPSLKTITIQHKSTVGTRFGGKVIVQINPDKQGVFDYISSARFYVESDNLRFELNPNDDKDLRSISHFFRPNKAKEEPKLNNNPEDLKPQVESISNETLNEYYRIRNKNNQKPMLTDSDIKSEQEAWQKYLASQKTVKSETNNQDAQDIDSEETPLPQEGTEEKKIIKNSILSIVEILEINSRNLNTEPLLRQKIEPENPEQIELLRKVNEARYSQLPITLDPEVANKYKSLLITRLFAGI